MFPVAKPCGLFHPLPCGLDRDCRVPVERYDADRSSEETVRAWDDVRIDAARTVVYDEDGELIDADALKDALAAYGVDVGTDDEGITEYRNVPRELPLSACHLAVDLRRDPAEFIDGRPVAGE